MIQQGATLSENNKLEALLLATSNNNFDMVRLLIANDAEINTVNVKDYTPILNAIIKNNIDLVQYLLDQGALINPKRSMSPLICATIYNRLDIVKLLIQYGADIDKLSKLNETPLMIAKEAGYTEIVKFLVESGAKVNSNSDDNPKSETASTIVTAAQDPAPTNTVVTPGSNRC